MMITKEEFYEMGFTADKEHEQLLENCIKRAGYVLDSLTGGRASSMAAAENSSAELIKQAAAFQTDEIFRTELATAKKNAHSESESSSTQNDERVTIGDFTYSTGSSSSNSSKNSSSSGEEDTVISHKLTVVRLLRAAGCLYCGTEVIP